MKRQAIFRTGLALCGAMFAGNHSFGEADKNHSLTISKISTMNTTEEKNKQSIRNLYEIILNKRKFELLNELISDEYTNPKGVSGVEGFRQQTLALVQAFPDAHWTILELMAEGNKVIVNQKLEGTHSGQFQNFAATGKKISNIGFAIYEFENGKIIRNQVQTDRLGFLQELEILPVDLTALPKKEGRDAVSLIDKFFIPKNSIEEFSERLHANKSFIKTLPGFIRIEEFEHRDDAGNLQLVTVAFWEKQSSVDSAKAAVQTEFKRTGFNPTEFYQRLNITLERGLYNRYEN